MATASFAADYKGIIPRGAMNDGGSSEESSAFTVYRIRSYMSIDENVVGAMKNNHNGYYDFFAKYKVLKCPSFDDEYALTYVVNSMDFAKAGRGTIAERHYNTEFGRGFDKFQTAENSEETMLFGEVNSNKLANNDFQAYNIWKYSDLPYWNGNIQLG